MCRVDGETITDSFFFFFFKLSFSSNTILAQTCSGRELLQQKRAAREHQITNGSTRTLAALVGWFPVIENNRNLPFYSTSSPSTKMNTEKHHSLGLKRDESRRVGKSLHLVTLVAWCTSEFLCLQRVCSSRPPYKRRTRRRPLTFTPVAVHPTAANK